MFDNALRWLTRISLGAVFFAWLVIGLGAFTRLTDAGLGCPDWPGCYGHVTVPTAVAAKNYPSTPLVAHKAWTEMVHRYCAGTLALLTIVVAALCVLCGVRYGVSYLLCALLIFVLVIYQALLGMWTVTLKLWPIVVTQHLLGGMGLLALLWMIHLKARAERVPKPSPTITGFAKSIVLLGLVLVAVQIALGAWTSTNYTALSCPDFPYCTAQVWFPVDFTHAFNIFSPQGINYEGGVLSESARQTIQMTHRIMALGVVIYLMGMMIYFFRRRKNNPVLLRALWVLLLVLIAQIILGILNVLLELPLGVAVLHNLVAALLLSAMVAVNFVVFRCGMPSRVSIPERGILYE